MVVETAWPEVVTAEEEQAQQREALLRQQEVERQRGPDENEA